MSDKVLKILAADDTEMNLDLLRRFIQRQGHELITAADRPSSCSRRNTRTWC